MDSLNSEVPTNAKDEQIWQKVLVCQLIYSLTGLFLGLVSIIGGIVLFLNGVLGSTSWAASMLGASGDISDAAPGSVLFIVGLFIVFVTRFKIKLKDTGDSRTFITQQPMPRINENALRLEDDEFGQREFSPTERHALDLALRLHMLVKVIANAQTGGRDQTFIDSAKVNGVLMDVHYEARSDQCHRAISLTLDAKYRLWCECRGWMHMNKDDELVYSQRPRPDIDDKFEGDMDAFIAVATEALKIGGIGNR